MADAMAVADYVIDKSNDIVNSQNNNGAHYQISNLYLQKLLYFLDIFYILDTRKHSKNGKQLFNDEFEAWTYGPVLRDVYEEYKSFGGAHIPHSIKHLNNVYTDSKGFVHTNSFKDGKLNRHDKKFIDNKLQALLNFSPFALVYYSHKDSQWSRKHINIDKDIYNMSKVADDYKNHPLPGLAA